MGQAPGGHTRVVSMSVQLFFEAVQKKRERTRGAREKLETKVGVLSHHRVLFGLNLFLAHPRRTFGLRVIVCFTSKAMSCHATTLSLSVGLFVWVSPACCLSSCLPRISRFHSVLTTMSHLTLSVLSFTRTRTRTCKRENKQVFFSLTLHF